MRRREFITLGGAAAAWPLRARAQQDGRVRRIGALIGGDEGDVERQASVAALRKALQDLGWTEGRNLRIDLRWAASDANRARTYAVELVALNPDVMFADNTFVVAALQQATRILPIVFARVTDPADRGFVSSLARPGGNITGFADRESSSLGKLAEFMKEIAPQVARVALITSTIANIRGVQEAGAAASSVGLRHVVAVVKEPREIEEAIVALGTEPNGSLIIVSDPFVMFHRRLIIELAARHKLPAIYSIADYVRDGGLMSYGVDRFEQYRGAAGYIDRILKGAKPADLPVQLPIKYQLVVNMKTAKALGLDMPPSILMRIDEVIE
jgi:putative tryptophan/tyrosine transport system substrate-binding protein